MAFQIEANRINENHANFNNNIIMMAPQFIHDQFYIHNQDVYTYNEFREILENNAFFPYNNNNNFTFNVCQYYLRYLISSGNFQHVEEFINVQLPNLIANNQPNQDFRDNLRNFLNYRQPEFNGTTILHHTLLWTNEEMLGRDLVHFGADPNIEDYQGNRPGENIHMRVWDNPFAPFLGMPLVFRAHNIIAFRNQNNHNVQWIHELRNLLDNN